MNPRLTLLATIGLAAFAPCVAIADDLPVPAALPSSGAHSNLPLLDAEQLDQLVGPVALHPDALIALILPAATAPSDIVLAARYLSAGGLVAKVDDQSWDDSVKSLARYPDIVQWMDENLAWTKQLGEVFDAQPADVMKAIQRMRAKARSLGHLQDTAQQRVEVVDGTIRIVPVQREVIYVPYYDPAVVYIEAPWHYGNPFLTFSAGFATGYWLAYDFDWQVNTIWVINRHDRERYWRDRREWHDWHPVVHADRPHYSPPSDCHEWRPSDRNRRPDFPRRPDSVVVAPGSNTRGPFVNVAVTNVSVGAPRRDDHRRPDGDRPALDQRPGNRSDPRRPSADAARTPRAPASDNRFGDRTPANSVTVAPEPTAAQPNTVTVQPPTNQASHPRYAPRPAVQPAQNNLPSNPATTPATTVERRDRPTQPTQPVATQPGRPTYNPANTPTAQPTNPHRQPREDAPTRTYTPAQPQPQPAVTRETPAAQPTRTYTPPHRETSERTYTPKSTPAYSPPAPERAPAPTPAPATTPAPSTPAPSSRSNSSDTQHRDAD